MNAISKVRARDQSPKPGTKILEDGSVLVSVEALTHFGDGDAKQGRKDLRLLLAAERETPAWSGPTARPLTVRMAVADDEDALLALLLLDLEANAAHVAVVDETRVLEHIRAGTRNRGGIVGVVGPVGAPVACVIIIPGQWWWSNSWHLLEVVNFVHPDHRRSRHADDLLDFAKWVSDEQSRGFGYRTPLLCGVLGAWRVRAKMMLYARKFWMAGAAYIYPAPTLKGN